MPKVKLERRGHKVYKALKEIRVTLEKLDPKARKVIKVKLVHL